MIIDVHAHCGRWYFPSNVTEPSQVSRLCDTFEINQIVFSSSLAILYDMVEGNRQTSLFVEEDERFHGYIYLNPSEPGASEYEISRYAENPSFVGVKMHPSYSGEQADSLNTMGLMRKLEKKTKVLIHTWGQDGVRRVCNLATHFPELQFIMGHMGGTDVGGWMAGIEGARDAPNTHLEICGSLLNHDRIAQAVRTIGPERILFGSDTTLISPAWSIGQVTGSDILEEEKRKILYENAALLFGFK